MLGKDPSPISPDRRDPPRRGRRPGCQIFVIYWSAGKQLVAYWLRFVICANGRVMLDRAGRLGGAARPLLRWLVSGPDGEGSVMRRSIAWGMVWFGVVSGPPLERVGRLDEPAIVEASGI